MRNAGRILIIIMLLVGLGLSWGFAETIVVARDVQSDHELNRPPKIDENQPSQEKPSTPDSSHAEKLLKLLCLGLLCQGPSRR